MKRTIYFRVSTEAQSYNRQLYQMTEYFNRMGISWDGAEIVSEKITSHTKFQERKIYSILKKAQEGDIIYVCQLDRLGRSTIDVLQLIEYAVETGVTIITIDNNQTIENKSNTGKLYITILAAMAEMERELRAERCRAGLEAAKEELAKKGKRIARCSGREQTHFGNEKGCDMSKAVEASAQKRTDAAIRWLEQSKAVKYARMESAKGRSVTEIAASLGELFNLHDGDGVNPYATPKGCKPCKGTVSRWLSETNPIAI